MNDCTVEGLVLSVNPTNNTAKCYSEQLECLIQVKLPRNIRATKGTFLVLSDFQFENGVYVPTPETFKTRKATKIHFHAGEMLIEAIAACSNNEVHATYNMEVAFSEGFGHVNTSGFQMQRGVAFYVDLALNNADGANEKEPIFRIVNMKQQVTGQLNKRFVERMMEFEDKQPIWEKWPDKLPNDEVQLSEVMSSPVTEHPVVEETVVRSDQLEAFACSSTSSHDVKGRLSTSNGTFETMYAQLKPETELSCLVVNVDDHIIGFEMTQLKLVMIKLDNTEECSKVRTNDTIRFIVGETRDGIVHIKQGTGVQIVGSRADEPIVARVAFSTHCHHLSYNFMIAVSDRYGYIQLPKGINDGSYARSMIYTVEISLNQFEDPLEPIFKAITTPNPIGVASDTDDDFFHTVNSFEERYSQERKEQLFGVNNVPRPPEPRRNVNRNAGSSDLEKMTTCSGLVFSLNPNSRNGFYGKVWTLRGDMDLRCIPQAETGDHVKMGDWVTVRIENGNRKSPARVSKILSRDDHKSMPMKLVGTVPVVSKGFSFSLLKEERDGTRFYDQGHLGLVETPPKIYENANITIVDFHKLENPYFVNDKKVFWMAKEHVSTPEVDKVNPQPESANRSVFSSCESNATRMNYQNKGPSHFAQDPSRRDTTPQLYSNGYHPNGSFSSQNGSGGPSRSQSQREFPIHEYGHQQNFAPPVQSPAPPMSTVSYSSYPRSQTGTAIAIKQCADGSMIVYLVEANSAATMHWERMEGRMVPICGVFKCEYQNIKRTNSIDFEITKVIELTNTKHLCRQVEDECQIVISINMCDYPVGMNQHSKYNVPHVMACDLGFVILAKTLRNPVGDTVSDRALIKAFERDERARDMVGWCRFVREEVQRENDPNSDLELRYVWQVVELCSATPTFTRREKEFQRENLGPAVHQYEEEDDIARQKRINKENEMSRSRLMSRNTDHPSNFDNNRGYNSSQSFHTANDGFRASPSIPEQSSSGYSQDNRFRGQEPSFNEPRGHYSSPPTVNFNQHPNNASYDSRDERIHELQTFIQRSVATHKQTNDMLRDFIHSQPNVNINPMITQSRKIDELINEFNSSPHLFPNYRH